MEYAKKPIPTEFSEDIKCQISKSDDDTNIEAIDKSQFQAFLRKLNSWTINHIFSQSPPANIRYKYAAPTKSTLIRIVVQMLKEPIFYTQVKKKVFILKHRFV